jgi:hypothetical protein
VNEPGLEGSFWPSERQKLLLRTAFAGGEASAAAWRSLRPQLDLDRLEVGSFPVLPLVHRQLAALGLEDPYVPRLAGIRRRTWAMNRLELDALGPALCALEDAGAEPVVVGGWELPAHYYDGDYGLRPVEGLEVLVRPSRAAAGARALAGLGFARARGGVPRFVGAHGRTCMLHARLAREFSVPERGLELEDLWDETVDSSLGDTRARVLGPSDELVRLCLEGARASVLANIVWLADALAVLASGAAIDWERVVRHALRLRSMLRLRDALVYLRRELGAPVPEAPIRELEAIPPRRRERRAHKEAGSSRRVLGPWPRTATRFLHVTADRPLPVALAALPTFLRNELGLTRRGEVPLEVARRAASRRRPTVEAK